MRDIDLAERLAVIDPALLRSGEEVRQRLLDLIEDRLAERAPTEVVQPGHEFHFLRSQLVVFPTETRVATPAGLAELLPRVSLGSIFLHFVEARLRPPRGEDDFSAWLESWDERGADLRARLETVDPMFGSLRELRARIALAVAAEAGPS